MKVPRFARPLVRRTVSVLPPSVGSFIRTLARFDPSKPTTGLPPASRVLVLAAHPDDESLGCAGTMALFADRGTDVAAVFATDGEALLVAGGGGDLAARRRAEAVEACRILGTQAPSFLGFPDRGLTGEIDRLAAALRPVVAGYAPQLVLLPWFADGNADHRALNVALAKAGVSGDVELWGYEIWSPLIANHLVDISDALDRKELALKAHASDVLMDLGAIVGLNRYRAEVGRLDGKHAEAFLRAPAERYFDLVRTADAGA
jgi:LmbE family N-acetylglucosaminyl deacetylase